MKSPKEVGQMIRSIRKEKGLTMEEFGKLIGNVKKSAVGNWERGDNFPNNERLKKIAEIGNIPVGILLGEDTDIIFSKLNELNDGLENGFSLNYDPLGKHEQTFLISVIDYMKQCKERETEKFYQGFELGKKDKTDKP